MKDSDLKKYNIHFECSNQGDFKFIYDQKEYLTGGILLLIGFLVVIGALILMFSNNLLSTPSSLVVLIFSLTSIFKGYQRIQNVTYFRVFYGDGKCLVERSINGKKVKREFNEHCNFILDQKENRLRILIDNYGKNGFIVFSHPFNGALQQKLEEVVSTMNQNIRLCRT